MVNNDLECADYRKKVAVPIDESEEKYMEVSENKEDSINTNFQQGVKKR